MYNNVNVAPMAMGIGGGSIPLLFGMQPVWAVLAAFAIVACASAVNRILPRMIVERQAGKASAVSVEAGRRPSAWLTR
jgi:hypothetical protein